jgi:hypothetical protein
VMPTRLADATALMGISRKTMLCTLKQDPGLPVGP